MPVLQSHSQQSNYVGCNCSDEVDSCEAVPPFQGVSLREERQVGVYVLELSNVRFQGLALKLAE